jgi:hypothetical protein
MEKIIHASARFPSITAQNVGRDLINGRNEAVRIVGDEDSLKTIAWIFERVPDMFDVQFQHSSLLVHQAGKTEKVASCPHLQDERI